MKRVLFLIVVGVFVVGCATATAVPSPTPTLPPLLSEPVVEETAVPLPEPAQPTAVAIEAEPVAIGATDEPTEAAPTETPVVEETSLVVSGRTEEGAYFLGDPEAPVTLIDYSDFL
ncbi:MAG: hypothetical protein GY943_18670 [Chloroflexi bacterium]|nr:hypothetical protein [Chloroflexota bacterium]